MIYTFKFTGKMGFATARGDGEVSVDEEVSADVVIDAATKSIAKDFPGLFITRLSVKRKKGK